MKLPLPAMVLFLFSPPPRRTPLAVIAELCQRPQKTSLSGWLPLPRPHHLSLHRSFSSPRRPRRPAFTHPLSLLLTIQTPSSL